MSLLDAQQLMRGKELKMDLDELVSAKEAQKLLGLKHTAFFAIANCEGFPLRHKVGKRAVRWSVKELMEWREKQKVRK